MGTGMGALIMVGYASFTELSPRRCVENGPRGSHLLVTGAHAICGDRRGGYRFF